MSSLEEDFNRYSEWFMTRPEALQKLVKQHPKIAKKVAIWQQFYLEIDPSLKSASPFVRFTKP